MTKINFTLEEDLITIIYDYFQSKGFSVEIGSLDTMLHRYYNYQSRQILAKPREVYESKEFIAINLTEEVEKAIAEIKCKFEAGEEINPYLSVSLSNPDFYDELYADLGIQHLHLDLPSGKRPQNTSFVRRTSELLFCYVTDLAAYFLLLLPHVPSPWSNAVLFEILHDNWPKLLSHVEMRGVIGVAHKVTSDDVKALHKERFNILRERGGKVYANLGPGMAMTKDGHSTYAVISAMRVKGILRDIEENITGRIDEIRAHIAILLSKPDLDSLTFGLNAEDGAITVIENTSKFKVGDFGLE